MERRRVVVLSMVAVLLIVISGSLLILTQISFSDTYSVGSVALSSGNVYNTVEGELDLNSESSKSITVKTNNESSDYQMCSYEIVYVGDAGSEFNVSIVGNGFTNNVLVSEDAQVLYEGVYYVAGGNVTSVSYTITSDLYVDGIVTVNNLVCENMNK